MHSKYIYELQKYRKSFKKALSSYRSDDLSEASRIIGYLSSRNLSNHESKKLEKVLLLLLYGELYGLNTLNKLLDSYGIQSNDYQRLWSSLSCGLLVHLMNRWLWILFSPAFIKSISQSASTQSRDGLTLIVDGSIFKQWLVKEEFGKYFAKYYSGQYGKAVYGFNVILCGMSLGGVFYPLHFQLRRKSEKDVEVAHGMLQKVYCKLEKVASEAVVDLPTLYLSVDSGFRSETLVTWCEAVGIHYIGVPKNLHLVYVNTHCEAEKSASNKLTISELKQEFERKEKEHKAVGVVGQSSFCWRVRSYYSCLGREVTFLLFRLNGSKKVSVIFCNDLNIKAKTLRRRWFERTKIELLFRSIKHDLKIQQTTVRYRLGFLKKLSFALVKALYAQLLTQRVKKIDKSLQRIGYEKIKQLLIFHQTGREWLDELLWGRPFAEEQ